MFPDLKTLFGGLMPPGTRIKIELELPAGAIAGPSDATAGDRPGIAIDATPTVVDISSARSATRAGRPTSSPTAQQRVEEIRRQRGDVWLKRDEWSDVTGISVRELERAQRFGPLKGRRKGVGLDSNATVLQARDVSAYLALVDAVLRGDIVPPDWWPMVRLGRAA